MHIEIYRDVDHKWRWKVVARNGRIVADGAEGYIKQATMKRTLRKLLVSLRNVEIPE